MNRQDAKTRRTIVEIREKQKVYFYLGVLCAFAVFFFNSLLIVEADFLRSPRREGRPH